MGWETLTSSAMGPADRAAIAEGVMASYVFCVGGEEKKKEKKKEKKIDILAIAAATHKKKKKKKKKKKNLVDVHQCRYHRWRRLDRRRD
jgi:hypothetical protein